MFPLGSLDERGAEAVHYRVRGLSPTRVGTGRRLSRSSQRQAQRERISRRCLCPPSFLSRFPLCPSVRPSVRPSCRPSVRFTSFTLRPSPETYCNPDRNGKLRPFASISCVGPESAGLEICVS
eukprot:scaffold172_cov254-Pinguiococcus_pyrenoidosus.AAC.22